MHKIALLALIAGRPDEAVEILKDFAPIPPSPLAVLGQGEPGEVDYCVAVQWIMAGRTYVVEVPDQKSLNALAGYFWVEPRRLLDPVVK